MKNQVKLGLVALIAGVVGFGLSNFAVSDALPAYKVAVVNLQAVASESAQVKAAKAENVKKMQDLQKWLKTAQADVEKQKTKEGKEKLLKKYEAEFAKKQKALQDAHNKKVQDIDKAITTTIAQEAKAQNFNLVLAKGTVLYGGTDITANIVAKVK